MFGQGAVVPEDSQRGIEGPLGLSLCCDWTRPGCPCSRQAQPVNQGRAPVGGEERRMEFQGLVIGAMITGAAAVRPSESPDITCCRVLEHKHPLLDKGQPWKRITSVLLLKVPFCLLCLGA